MDPEERDVCNFLKSWPGQFVGLREICRRAGGKRRYRDDEHWASPILLRLVGKGLVEDDQAGHFRLIPTEKKKKKTKWVSPQIRKILEQSGKTFDLETDEE